MAALGRQKRVWTAKADLRKSIVIESLSLNIFHIFFFKFVIGHVSTVYLGLLLIYLQFSAYARHLISPKRTLWVNHVVQVHPTGMKYRHSLPHRIKRIYFVYTICCLNTFTKKCKTGLSYNIINMIYFVCIQYIVGKHL